MNMISFPFYPVYRRSDVTSRTGGATRCWAKSNRRGSLLVEVGIATVVLVTVMGMTVKVFSTVAHERRSASDRQLGSFEVANLMERITAYPYDQVNRELAGRMSVSTGARQALRESELAVEISGGERTAGGVQRAKRVMIRLRWKGPGNQWQAPVRLTAWIEPGRPRP